jgi:hypothetical protein
MRQRLAMHTASLEELADGDAAFDAQDVLEAHTWHLTYTISLVSAPISYPCFDGHQSESPWEVGRGSLPTGR